MKFTQARLKCKCGNKIGIYNKCSNHERGSTFVPLRGTLRRITHRTYHHQGKIGIIIQIRVQCNKCKQTTTKTVKEVLK